MPIRCHKIIQMLFPFCKAFVGAALSSFSNSVSSMFENYLSFRFKHKTKPWGHMNREAEVALLEKINQCRPVQGTHLPSPDEGD